jgi:hypothetical protein
LPPSTAIAQPRPELFLGFSALIGARLIVSAHDAGKSAIGVEIAPTPHRLTPRVQKFEVLPTGFPRGKAALLAYIILADKRIISGITVYKEAIGGARFQGELEGPVLFAVARSRSQNVIPMDFTAERLCHSSDGRKACAR